MADVKISDLTSAASIVGTDVLEIDTGTLSRKVTGTQVRTFTNAGFTVDRVVITDGSGNLAVSLVTPTELLVLDGVTITTTELNRLSGITGNVQTSLDAKQDESGLTASRVLETSAGGVIQVSAVTAAELAILDGATLSTAELNILDGVTATAAELNVLDGITASTAELNITDGITATAVEINVLDGSTATTADFNEIAGIANFTEGLRVYLTPQTVSSTGAQTLGATHQNSFLYMTNASTTTWTIPPNSTTAFNVGTEIEFWRSDASVVIVEGSGVTLNGHDGTTAVTTTATIGTQHTGCCIKKVATDTWVVFGRFTGS